MCKRQTKKKKKVYNVYIDVVTLFTLCLHLQCLHLHLLRLGHKKMAKNVSQSHTVHLNSLATLRRYLFVTSPSASCLTFCKWCLLSHIKHHPSVNDNIHEEERGGGGGELVPEASKLTLQWLPCKLRAFVGSCKEIP